MVDSRITKQAKRVATAKRRRLAVQLALRGHSPEEIYEEIHRKLDPEEIPDGYKISNLRQDVAESLRYYRKALSKHTEDLRAQQLARTELAIKAIMPLALGRDPEIEEETGLVLSYGTEPSTKALDRLIMLMKRQAELAGLDAATIARLSDSDDDKTFIVKVIKGVATMDDL